MPRCPSFGSAGGSGQAFPRDEHRCAAHPSGKAAPRAPSPRREVPPPAGQPGARLWPPVRLVPKARRVWMPAGLVLWCNLPMTETGSLLPQLVVVVAEDSFALVIPQNKWSSVSATLALGAEGNKL